MTKTLNYKVIFERDEDGVIIASVPSLPGCHTFGSTIEEAEENVIEAMEGYVEALCLAGDPIPQEEITSPNE